MAHCKACDASYVETKDHYGNWKDLCSRCYHASAQEAYESQVGVEGLLEDREKGDALGAPLVPSEQLWTEALGRHEFTEGLGLRLSQGAVEAHLRMRATERFSAALESGMSVVAAIDVALGKVRLRGDQRDAQG
jgi:hypothetical protein